MKRCEETWNDIEGYEGYYRISDMGRVLSLRRWKVAGRAKYWTKEKVLKQRLEPNRYAYVGLHKNGKMKLCTIHRLVCLAFLGEPQEDQKETNHKNGNKHDNRLSNLEWCTHSENELHSYRVLGKKITRQHKLRPIVGIHKETGQKIYFKSPIEAFKGGFNRNICRAIRNPDYTSDGYYCKEEKEVKYA